MRLGGERHAPAALPPGKTRPPLYRRLGGLQGRSEQERKISPQPGFDPWSIQLVAIRYTDYCTNEIHVWSIGRMIVAVYN